MDICKENLWQGGNQLNANSNVKRKTLHAHFYRALLNGHCGKLQHNSATTERSSEAESGKRQRVDSESKHDHISSIACDPSLTSVVSALDHIQRNQPCSAPSLERDVQGEVPSSKTTNTDGQITSAVEDCQNLHSAKDGKGVCCVSSSSPVLGVPDLSCGGEPLADPKAAPQVNPTSVGHEEYWVPVRLSHVQLEQYCAALIENSKFLCCNAKREALSGLHDILMTVRQCCDHPYLVDRSLERFLIKDRQTVDPLDTGIQVSGKLQLLTEFLPLIKERGLRVLILFQSCSLGKKAPKIGHILDDIMFRKFGEDSYVHVYPISRLEYSGCRSKKQDAVNIFNRESGRFVILMDKSACHPNIKISSVDIVILFNSDWDPLSDMKTLQKVTLQPRFGAVKVFRLFAPWTVEEKALVLAKQGTPIDSKLPQYSYRAYHKLLVWGVKYLFGSLSAFHGSTSSTFDSLLLSDEAFRLNVMSELSSVLSFEYKGCDADCSVISKVKACPDGYQGSISLHDEVEDMSVDELPPHAFWGDLFSASLPVWKFLPDEAVKPRRGRQIDGFVADFNDGKETESEMTKCRQVTDSVGLGTSLCSALGLRRKRNPRTKRDELAASRFARFVVSALPSSPAKKSSDSEGECQKCSTPGVQSSSCLVNGADCFSHSDASSLMPQLSPEMLQRLHSCRKRKRFFDSADNNISTPGDSSSVSQISHEKSQSGLICGKRKKLVDSEGNNLSAPVDSIAETCGRRMIALLQKQKEEYEDFVKIMRKENEMLQDEYQLELSLIHGETAAEQGNRANLDKKFKEKLVNHAHHMILKKKDLQARQLSERIYENSLRERWLNGQQEDSAEVAVKCQRSGEVGAVSAMFVPGDSNEVSPRCSATGPAALSTESNGENDLVVTAFLQTPDSYKKQPRDVFDLGLSKKLVQVSSSEKMNENVENASEKEQETYTEHGDGPDKELLNEPAMGGDLSCLLGEASSGVPMDENCPSAAPLIPATDLDSDHGVVMNPDKDDIAPRQQEVELSTNKTPATETMETNLSSLPVDVEMSAGNSPPVAVQMSETNSPVAVEQPACSPRGETVPNTVPVSVPVTQRNGSDGVVNQDEVCVQSQVRNQALSSIVSSSSTPVASPLCETSTLLASGVGHDFSTAARFESGTVNNTRPYQKQHPLRFELERLQREEEESVQKHDYMMKVLQAAYQKEMEELRKKYETMVKGVDDALLQKKTDIKRRHDVAFSHMLLADFSRLVANTPELSITGAPESSRESHSISANQSQQPPPQLVVCSPRPSSSAIRPPIQVVNRFTDLVSSDAIMTPPGTVLQPSSGGYQFQAPSSYLRPHGPVQSRPCFPLSLYNGQFGMQPVQTWPNISNNGSRQIGYFGGLPAVNGSVT